MQHRLLEPGLGLWNSEGHQGSSERRCRENKGMQDSERADTSHTRHQHDGVYIQLVTQLAFRSHVL